MKFGTDAKVNQRFATKKNQAEQGASRSASVISLPLPLPARGAAQGREEMRVWMKRIFLLAVMACYLAFAYLMYQRWVTTEQAMGAPVPFVALVGIPEGAQGEALAILTQRVSWAVVLAPLWVADSLTVVAHVMLLLFQHAWRPLPASLNARIEHVSGALRAIL